MSYLSADGEPWSDVVFVSIFGFGSMVLVFTSVLLLIRWFVEYRKTRLLAGHQDGYRRLLDRYEQLSASTMDAQQRAATDLAELRTRVTAVERLLRTVDDR
jgi:hypothetical protein